MKDRFTEAVSEMQERSAFACETCDHHVIGKAGHGGGRVYDINRGLRLINRDPSPAGP
jgi:hypothetical protein